MRKIFVNCRKKSPKDFYLFPEKLVRNRYKKGNKKDEGISDNNKIIKDWIEVKKEV